MKTLFLTLALAGGTIGKPSEDEFTVECRAQSQSCEEQARKLCKSDKVVALDTSFKEKAKLFQKYSECSESEKMKDPAAHYTMCGDQKSAWLNLKKHFSKDSAFKRDSVEFERKSRKDSVKTYRTIRYSCDTNYFVNAKMETNIKEEIEE